MLLLLGFFGFVIWAIYLGASGSFEVLGNCGPSAFLGRAGHWEGGSASTMWTAAALGGILWVMAGVAAGAVIVSRRNVARDTFLVVMAFIVTYVVALLILGLAVSPLIWGPRHCVY